MPDLFPEFKCPQCGELRNRKFFYIDGIDTPRERKAQRCWSCRAAEQVWKELHRQYDWASAICKSTLMSLNHNSGVNPPDPADWPGDLKPLELRAIMEYQDRRCALDQLPLVFPNGEKLRKNITLETWAKEQKLNLRQRMRMPLLVRISKTEAWRQGNVVFIARMYEMPYQYYGSVMEVGLVLKRAELPCIPTPQALEDIKANILRRLEETCNAEAKKRNEETAADHATEVP